MNEIIIVWGSIVDDKQERQGCSENYPFAWD
jgi:hypothetical protein